MVDNRSAGFFGIGGGFNFKGGDISGSAAKLSDDKMGQGSEYFQQGEWEEEQEQNAEPYVDRSSRLRATLNSLAMMNVANVVNSKKRPDFLDSETEDDEPKEDLDEEYMDDFSDDEDETEVEYY